MTGAQEGGEFFTPMSLVNTIVNVIEPNHGIVFDPACAVQACLFKPVILLKKRDGNLLKMPLWTGESRANTKLAR